MSSIGFRRMENGRLNVYGVTCCFVEIQSMEPHICMLIWQDVLLGRLMDEEFQLDRLSLREKLFNCCPTAADWDFAKEMIDRLKLFYDITTLWSGTRYVTANMFFPKVCGIQLAIRKWTTPDYELLQQMSEEMKKKYELMQQMSKEMKKKFQKYWTDIHGLMAIATVLDPRYKLHMVQALYGFLYGPEAASLEVMRVKQLLRDLLVEYQDASCAGSSNAPTSSQSTSSASQDEVFDIFERYMSSQPTVSSLLVHTELDLYLEEPALPRTQDFDIINWWKFGGIKYPTLQLIAHDILPIPVTTVASESAFSTSGRILSSHRSRLAPKMVESIMCMQAWSNADILGENNSSLSNEFQSCLTDEDEPMDEELSTCNNH